MSGLDGSRSPRMASTRLLTFYFHPFSLVSRWLSIRRIIPKWQAGRIFQELVLRTFKGSCTPSIVLFDFCWPVKSPRSLQTARQWWSRAPWWITGRDRGNCRELHQQIGQIAVCDRETTSGNRDFHRWFCGNFPREIYDIYIYIYDIDNYWYIGIYIDIYIYMLIDQYWPQVWNIVFGDPGWNLPGQNDATYTAPRRSCHLHSS